MLRISCKFANTFKIKKVDIIYIIHLHYELDVAFSLFFNVQLYVSLINMRQKEHNFLYNSNDILV